MFKIVTNMLLKDKRRMMLGGGCGRDDKKTIYEIQIHFTNSKIIIYINSV